MAIAIRDDVAQHAPYGALIERLLLEGRSATVYRCPKEKCPVSLFVFCVTATNMTAIEHHLNFLLGRSHPDHDPICTLNEDLPPEVENLITGSGS